MHYIDFVCEIFVFIVFVYLKKERHLYLGRHEGNFHFWVEYIPLSLFALEVDRAVNAL